MSAEEAERQGLLLGWERNCVYVKVEQGLLCVHDSLIVDLHKPAHDLSDTSQKRDLRRGPDPGIKRGPAVQQADALLIALRRALFELHHTLFELRRTLLELRRTLLELRRTLLELRRTLLELSRTAMTFFVWPSGRWPSVLDQMAPAQGHGSLARERIEERAEQVSLGLTWS